MPHGAHRRSDDMKQRHNVVGRAAFELSFCQAPMSALGGTRDTADITRSTKIAFGGNVVKNPQNLLRRQLSSFSDVNMMFRLPTLVSLWTWPCFLPNSKYKGAEYICTP